jgi:hypothetical protein
MAAPPSLELEQLQEAWQRTIVPAVEERSIPAASVLREAHPAELAGDTLTVEFPASASFHRQLAEEPKNATLLADALYEVTGRHLGLAFAEGKARAEAIKQIKIDPKAIDPNDAEMLEDMILAAVNEAVRAAQSLMESKLGGLAGGALGGLGLPGLGD